jgi:ribosomal protein S27AE
MTDAEIIERLQSELQWAYDRLEDANRLLAAASERTGTDLKLLLERFEVAGSECPRCGGSGMVDAPDGEKARKWPCDDCNMTGKKGGGWCSTGAKP